MAKKPSLFHRWIFAGIGLAAAAAILLLLLFPAKLRNDLKMIFTEEYDSLFLSMYPIDNYSEEDYAYWRGMDIAFASHEISNLTTLKGYLQAVSRAGRDLHTIYLGVMPGKIESRHLLAQLLTYPDIHFEVVLAYPSLDYWRSLSQEACAKLLRDYRDCAEMLINHENIAVYSFSGSQWLISNPANYEADFLTTEEISEFLMLHSDQDHAYVLTGENWTTSMDAMKALIDRERGTPSVYPDLSDWSIVFFGDSVIAGYTDSTSIPGVAAGLTGARSYNFGLGGGHAARRDEYHNSLRDYVNAFLQKDASLITFEGGSAAEPFSASLTQYLEDAPQGPHCFVIQYGFNDYFDASPISREDPYDLNTFAGSLRSSIQALQEAFPDAAILLSTPTFTTYFGNGTEAKGEAGHVFADYIDALLQVARETHVMLLDNYHQLDINEKNHAALLSDGCHPNEAGRFIIAERIVQRIGGE